MAASIPHVSIIHADALEWLSLQKDYSIPNVVTGICDNDEITPSLSMDDYIIFFQDIATSIFQKLDPNGYAIFIQTSRKYNRQLIDKSFLLTQCAERCGLKLVWHKIVLHRAVGATDLHRPTFAHMLCYTQNGTSGAATPDVIDVSNKLYKNGTPNAAAVAAVEFIARYSKKKTIVDPFVGRGTILAVARDYGLASIGIDISKEQCELTRKLLNN